MFQWSRGAALIPGMVDYYGIQRPARLPFGNGVVLLTSFTSIVFWLLLLQRDL